MKTKIILIDWNIFAHRAIFATAKNAQMSAEYCCVSMILGCLTRIGVNPEDEIMLALDYGKSWRKSYDYDYKANRKAYRESFANINWKDLYERMNILRDKLEMSTNWQILKSEGLEADDWCAVASRFFSNNIVVIVSYDKDLEQLLSYDNVRIFSPLTKTYKKVDNPYKCLSEKIKKEASDNLNSPILNEADFEKRNLIVNLLSLPEFVEQPAIEGFRNLELKGEDLDHFPFSNLRQRYENLNNPDPKKIVNYEKEMLKKDKKVLKLKKLRKEKRLIKKGEKINGQESDNNCG